MLKQIIFILYIFCFCTAPIAAQFQIDLRKTPNASPLKQLEMGHVGPAGKEIRINSLYMTEAGKPVIPVMGEFHYSRYDCRFWKDALLKMKASGVTVVSTYVLWILHEEIEGKQSWTGNCNLRRFVELCGELGLKVHLRIGPYSNAEIRNGGLPDWLVKNPNVRCRTNDPLYLAYAQRWYEAIFSQVGDLLWKDQGPIMAVQLENEYVTKGLVVAHLTKLKEMALNIGYDVPLYSITHWMSADNPKEGFVSYAGYYIETPWAANGREELPPSSFEFFSYKRISDNIGTDLIKPQGDVVSLNSGSNDSPYFTCEVGVGTTSFYYRRAVVPEEMAGENINLRLGCGVNLMGYYMYTGGSNPVGECTTLQSSGPCISYDYQAPVREFGTLGVVMKETKKLNYFMNDFGSTLAPAISYLPKSNNDTSNLQWAVRTDGKSGYLFCSNYLYKNDRKDYKDVQFHIRLKGQELRIPRQKVTVENRAYFLWPFNQDLDGVKLTYSTTQPICRHTAKDTTSFFFFADDRIPGEYLIQAEGIQDISLSKGRCRKEKEGYFIDQLTPGKECVIEITRTNGECVRLITLTEEESDYIWKGTTRGENFVAISQSTLIYDDQHITVSGEEATQTLFLYGMATEQWTPKEREGLFSKYLLSQSGHSLEASAVKLAPMANAHWISPATGKVVQRTFYENGLSPVDKVTLRIQSDDKVDIRLNGKEIKTVPTGSYLKADLTRLYQKGNNEILLSLQHPTQCVLSETEVLLKNGTRLLWETDGTWTLADGREPVRVHKEKERPAEYAEEEHLALYQIKLPELKETPEEVRLRLSFVGDYARAYIGNRLVNDLFCDGTSWTLGVNRYHHLLGKSTPLVIRIEGFHSDEAKIYFEKGMSAQKGFRPMINDININREYKFEL